MATATTHRVDWSLLLGQRAFRFFFTAMFVSLFGSGMNFTGVSWYIMSATHSTVAVSWQVIVVTLPGFGFIEAGWAIGAIAGGIVTSQLPQRLRLPLYVLAVAGMALGHVAVPFIAVLFGAVILQSCFGFFRALAGIVAQSSLMSIVPKQFMGRTQSAFAIFATVLQLAMSFSLGWIAERFTIAVGFFLLAAMYAGATLTASRARKLLHASS